MFTSVWGRLGSIVAILWLIGCGVLYFQVQGLNNQIEARVVKAPQIPPQTNTWEMIQSGWADEIERQAAMENEARAYALDTGRIEDERDNLAGLLYMLLALPIGLGIFAVVARWVSAASTA